MDREISALPARHSYWARSQTKRVALDGVKIGNLEDRNLMQYWVAKYLNKEMKDAKLSVFANVTDGICVQGANGIAKANHHNMVVILDILQSIVNHKPPREKVVVITFFPEAVVAMREFFTSQGLLNIRIKCLDSENISTEENLVAIIDCPMTGHVRWNSFHGKDGQGENLTILRQAQDLLLLFVYLEHCESLSETIHLRDQLLVMVGEVVRDMRSSRTS
jgi:hypothetical protein